MTSTDLPAAENARDAAQDHLTDLEKKHTTVVEQIEQTEKALADYEALPGAQLNSNTILNAEKSRRYHAQQSALRARLETEITTARDRLRAANREVDRARLPLVLAELASHGATLNGRVRAAVAELRELFQAHAKLKKTGDDLQRSTGERVRFDEIALAWTLTTGSETGGAIESGLIADRFLVELAKALFAVGRIEETARAADARRAREEAEAARLASMSPEERERSAAVSFPGLGRVGPAARRTTDHIVGVPSDQDRRMLAQHRARQLVAEHAEQADYDPFTTR